MDIRCCSALVLASLPLIAQQPGKPAESGVNSNSLEKEAALRRQMAAETQRRTTTINSSSIQDYVDGLGRRISAQIPDAKFPFTFSVVADDPCSTTHEPGALPGGYVFIPAALFVEARDEAEFAGMLAHSMEHIAQLHATRLANRGQMVNSASIPPIFVGGWSASCSEPMAIPVGLLEAYRNNELKADASAVQTMARAGFDPGALARYIERVQTQPTKSFSLLPSRDQRVAAMRLLMARLPSVDYQVTSAEFVVVQQEVIRLTKRRDTALAPPTLRRN
jgi:beta-barrel assembly-enhancing protease